MRLLFLSVLFLNILIGNGYAAPKKIGPIIYRNSENQRYCHPVPYGGYDVNLCIMNLYSAYKYCESRGGLPTARDFAEFAQAHGARGILEFENSPGGRPEGYQVILKHQSTTTGKKIVDFYYNHRGFQMPDESWRLTPWTLTRDWSIPHVNFFFHFNWHTGLNSIAGNADDPSPVRCLDGR